MSYKKIKLISPVDIRRPEEDYIYLGHDSVGLWRKYPDNTYDYIQSGVTVGAGGSYWSIDMSNNLYYITGSVFVGTTPYSPSEKFVVDGAITIANATYSIGGTIKYTSNKFYGYNGSSWVEFGSGTTGGATSSFWDSNAYGIYYDSGKVYIGVASGSSGDPALNISGNAIIKGTSSLLFGDNNHIKSDTSDNLELMSSSNDIYLYAGSSDSWRFTTTSIYNTSTTAYLGSNSYKFGAIYAKNLEMVEDSPLLYIESKSSSALGSAHIRLMKSYNVSDGDSLGRIEWYGDPSTSATAMIEAVAGENFGLTSVATTLKMKTANTSSTTPVTRIYIDPNGYVGINREDSECEAELHVSGVTKSHYVYASSLYKVDDGVTTKNGITQTLTIISGSPSTIMKIVGGIIVFYGQYIPD